MCTSLRAHKFLHAVCARLCVQGCVCARLCVHRCVCVLGCMRTTLCVQGCVHNCVCTAACRGMCVHKSVCGGEWLKVCARVRVWLCECVHASMDMRVVCVCICISACECALCVCVSAFVCLCGVGTCVCARVCWGPCTPPGLCCSLCRVRGCPRVSPSLLGILQGCGGVCVCKNVWVPKGRQAPAPGCCVGGPGPHHPGGPFARLQPQRLGRSWCGLKL